VHKVQVQFLLLLQVEGTPLGAQQCVHAIMLLVGTEAGPALGRRKANR
jgi:hypothetical protein